MEAKEASTKYLILMIFMLLLNFCEPINERKQKNIIREINKRGPYIGLITVVSAEDDAFLAVSGLKLFHKHPFVDLSGRRFLVGRIHDKKVIYVKCGRGMVNAAAATQQMLDVFEIKGIIHFGIAGNVNNSMSIGDVTIPQQFVHTGIWDWMNPNEKLPENDVAHLEFGNYNVPKGEKINLLGRIGYGSEQFFSDSGEPNTPKSLLWAPISKPWLDLAASLEGIELQQCVNSSLCLPERPKVVVGLKGSTANTFVDNAAYRDFLFQTFEVSSVDMESSAIVMVSSSFRCEILNMLTQDCGSFWLTIFGRDPNFGLDARLGYSRNRYHLNIHEPPTQNQLVRGVTHCQIPSIFLIELKKRD